MGSYPLPNFKIQDKILQLYSIELVQSWLVARNAGQPPQNRKKRSSSACFNSEPTTNLCYRGLVVFLELKYCSEKFASFLHS